jgi:hypothetical protein
MKTLWKTHPMKTTTPQQLAAAYAELHPEEKLPLDEDTYRIFGD